MRIAPEIYAAHERLGQLSKQVLHFMLAHPELVSEARGKGGFLARLMGAYDYQLQPWPVFVGGDQLKAFHHATVVCTRLVKTLPERFFQNDPEKMAAFYGYTGEAFKTLLQSPFSGIEAAFCRLDMIFSEDGIKLLEVNTAANLGGWNQRFATGRQLRTPLMSRFRKRVSFNPTGVDTGKEAMNHIITETLKGSRIDGRRLNLALAVRRRYRGLASFFLNRLFKKALRARGSGLSGKVVFCPYRDLKERDGKLYLGSRQIHAVLKITDAEAPSHVWDTVARGNVSFFNTLACRYLGDKRNLALLSENEDSEMFSPEEQEIIGAYIPWTRLLTPRETTFRDAALRLPEDLLTRREDFVIKKGGSTQGVDVVIGRAVDDEVWREKVEHALKQGDWVVQEMVLSLTWMFYHRAEGKLAPHQGVWGGFCFGDRFGGGILRVAPTATGDDVINAKRGATVVILLETD